MNICFVLVDSSFLDSLLVVFLGPGQNSWWLPDYLHNQALLNPPLQINIGWLVVSTQLKNIGQIGSFLQVGMNIKKYFKPPTSRVLNHCFLTYFIQIHDPFKPGGYCHTMEFPLKNLYWLIIHGFKISKKKTYFLKKKQIKRKDKHAKRGSAQRCFLLFIGFTSIRDDL